MEVLEGIYERCALKDQIALAQTCKACRSVSSAQLRCWQDTSNKNDTCLRLHAAA